MNKLLLTAILYLFFGSLSAQTNYAAHGGIDKPTGIYKIDNLTYYTTAEDSNEFSKARIYCFNNTLKFRCTFSLGEKATISDIKKLSNGNIGVCGWFMLQCDVLELTFFYTEIDTNGNKLGGVANPIYMQNTYKSEVEFFELSGGDKMVFADSIMGIVSGQTLNLYPGNLGIINSSYTDTVHHLGYLNHSATTTTVTNYFNVYDLQNGNLVSMFQFPYTVSKLLKAPNKFYYGLTDSSYVIKFDTLFNVISSSKIGQGTHKINDFDVKQDTIYACTENSRAVLKFDANLNQVYQYANTQSLIKFSRIKVTDNSVILLASEEANNSGIKYPNSLMANAALNGQLILKNDASVEEAFVLSGTSDPFPTNNTTPVYVNAYYSLMVKVRNNGTDTLTSVYLNQRPWYSQSFICGYYLNHYLAESLSIPPGQYAYISMPTYYDRFLVYPGQHPVNDSISLSTTCVWTSAPNMDGDNNHMNDALCNVNIKLPVPTGIKEKESVNSVFTVYPNPANQWVTISYRSKKLENMAGMELKVVNELGELVKSATLTAETSVIDIEDLDRGVYLIGITKSGNSVYTTKFVKME